jgi:SAM-dependent methyltransferase
MNAPTGFHSSWETKYQSGFSQRYPWDVVVTFVFRNAPKGVPHDEIGIVEIGSGSGSNLWFAAREGFRVAGIDGSATAVAAARERFAAEGLSGSFELGDFTKPLPWPDASFDLAIDRGSLTCTDDAGMAAALKEIHRILKPGGRLLTTQFADNHTSRASGRTLPNGLTVDMQEGSGVGIEALRFYSQAELQRLFSAGGWNIREFERMERTGLLQDRREIHSEFRIIAER